MADLVALIANQDYGGIAAKIKEMKRLWDGIQDQGNTGTPEKRVKGLLLRRDKEADRVLNSNRAYKPDEILYIPLS
jgi:hypothetical protein